MSGTFTAVPQPRGAPFCFNVLICFAVIDLHFESPHFTVSGSEGPIIVSSLDPGFVSADLAVTIGGEPVRLTGGGPFSEQSYPPPFAAIALQGSDYHVAIFAEPAH